MRLYKSVPTRHVTKSYESTNVEHGLNYGQTTITSYRALANELWTVRSILGTIHLQLRSLCFKHAHWFRRTKPVLYHITCSRLWVVINWDCYCFQAACSRNLFIGGRFELVVLKLKVRLTICQVASTFRWYTSMDALMLLLKDTILKKSFACVNISKTFKRSSRNESWWFGWCTVMELSWIWLNANETQLHYVNNE